MEATTPPSDTGLNIDPQRVLEIVSQDTVGKVLVDSAIKTVMIEYQQNVIRQLQQDLVKKGTGTSEGEEVAGSTS